MPTSDSRHLIQPRFNLTTRRPANNSNQREAKLQQKHPLSWSYVAVAAHSSCPLIGISSESERDDTTPLTGGDLAYCASIPSVTDLVVR